MTTQLLPKATVMGQMLKPLKRWIIQFRITSVPQAHRLCQLLPAQCPFERDIVWFGRILFHIPALCQLNPVYDELMELRFRALTYLAERKEDISLYIR